MKAAQADLGLHCMALDKFSHCAAHMQKGSIYSHLGMLFIWLSVIVPQRMHNAEIAHDNLIYKEHLVLCEILPHLQSNKNDYFTIQQFAFCTFGGMPLAHVHACRNTLN